MVMKDTLHDLNDGPSNEFDGVSAKKPLRADGKRNRERVLNVAIQAFASDGIEIPIDEIAHRAGVGIGTVYRHFPTKDALYEAVLISYKQGVVEKGKDMLTHEVSDSAFYGFLSQIVREGLTNKVLVDAVARAGVDIQRTFSGISLEFRNVLGELLSRAQQTGAVRVDIRVSDVIAIISGVMLAMDNYGHDYGGLDRILSVIFDGLRIRKS